MISRKKAVDEFCKQCIYDPSATGCGTWRQQVENCTSTKCPLYPIRPTSAASKDENNDTGNEENEDL